MPITRCADQTRKSLEEHYKELLEHKHPASHTIAEGMLSLIDLINELFKETQLWGLTSHYRLVLLNEDSVSPWYVLIHNSGLGEFHFEYLMPERLSPWPRAWVTGEAKNLEEAKQYLLLAMYRSEGWKDCEELKKLMNDIIPSQF